MRQPIAPLVPFVLAAALGLAVVPCHAQADDAAVSGIVGAAMTGAATGHLEHVEEEADGAESTVENGADSTVENADDTAAPEDEAR